jgi:Negative regulator of sigma F
MLPVEGLKPVRRLPSPWALASGIFTIGLLAVAIGTRSLGFSGWQALAPYQRVSIFAGLSMAGASASVFLARQMFPTLSHRIAPAICVAAVLTAIVATPILLMPLEYDGADFVELGAACAGHGVWYALLASVPIWFVVRRGYFVQPAWVGALAGLASGLCSLAVLEAHCPLIERSHVLVWHAGVVMLSVLASAALAYFSSNRQASKRTA